MASRGNTASALEDCCFPKAECVAALCMDWDLQILVEVWVTAGMPETNSHPYLESEGCYLGASGEIVVGLLGTTADNRSWSCWGTLSVGID